MAEISENVQPPKNMTSIHFDPEGESFAAESAEKEISGIPLGNVSFKSRFKLENIILHFTNRKVIISSFLSLDLKETF